MDSARQCKQTSNTTTFAHIKYFSTHMENENKACVYCFLTSILIVIIAVVITSLITSKTFPGISKKRNQLLSCTDFLIVGGSVLQSVLSRKSNQDAFFNKSKYLRLQKSSQSLLFQMLTFIMED